jgi:hypothetical protein
VRRADIVSGHGCSGFDKAGDCKKAFTVEAGTDDKAATCTRALTDEAKGD